MLPAYFKSFNQFSRSSLVVYSAVICIILSVLLTHSTIMAKPAEQQELQVLEGNSKFANNMYKALAEENKGKNIFFSPVSAHAVLSMAYLGSAGTTQKAFESTLYLPSKEVAATGYDNVMDRLNNVPNVTLHIANKAYILNKYKFKPAFENAVVKQFHSEIESIDFNKKEEAAGTINGWVNTKTKGKIDKLFEPDAFSSDTRLVLVNAIYFKGDWASKFEKSQTKTEPFYLDDKNTVDVQMMHQKSKFNYKEDKELNAKVLEMPYSNPDVSMVIILPNDKNGINELEKKLEGKDLNTITEGMWNTEVIVSLPKFKIETKMELEDTLKKMGLGVIFEDNSNFSEMIDSQEPLVVSKVIQKAFIEVNEEGSEAAAATGAELSDRMWIEPERFVANRHFVVLLTYKNEDQQIVLFDGRVSNPTISEITLRSALSSSTNILKCVSWLNLLITVTIIHNLSIFCL